MRIDVRERFAASPLTGAAAGFAAGAPVEGAPEAEAPVAEALAAHAVPGKPGRSSTATSTAVRQCSVRNAFFTDASTRRGIQARLPGFYVANGSSAKAAADRR